MENANPFHEQGFCRACERLSDAVRDLWESGAETEEIEGEITTALYNVLPERSRIYVEIA